MKSCASCMNNTRHPIGYSGMLRFHFFGAFGERDVSFCIAVADGEMVLAKDGFRSDTDEIGSRYHLLPYFNSDTNANRIFSDTNAK